MNTLEEAITIFNTEIMAQTHKVVPLVWARSMILDLVRALDKAKQENKRMRDRLIEIDTQFDWNKEL
jgi:hypothetical protein